MKQLPLPVSGVALGLAALGNLLQPYSSQVRSVLGVIAGFLLLALILKWILLPESLREDLNNPVTASVGATFPMAWMLLAAYLKPHIGGAAQVIWYAAVLLHVVLIIYFSVRFLFRFSLKHVFASWYIVYVGIVVSSVSAPAFGRTDIGSIAFWFGLISVILLLIIVTIRYSKLPVPEPARPLVCIYTAPVSLCVAGYVQSVADKSIPLLLAMYTVSVILYLFSFVQAIRCLRLPFYPSYAAFAFPFVISAIASRSVIAVLTKAGVTLPGGALIPGFALAQTVIAACLTLYALLRYLIRWMQPGVSH
jgi:exfoliative toxin A/B